MPPDSRPVRSPEDVERCFLELRDPLFRYLRILGCRVSLAEEIAQETFLRLHRGLRDGLGIKDVRAWVFHVARNLWIDSRRELLRDFSARASLLTRGDSAFDPEQQVLHRERERRIQEEIARLPPLQRDCVCLKAQGLRYYEIAGALGISMSAAVDAVRLAVKRLARRLSE